MKVRRLYAGPSVNTQASLSPSMSKGTMKMRRLYAGPSVKAQASLSPSSPKRALRMSRHDPVQTESIRNIIESSQEEAMALPTAEARSKYG